jgi:hypothetical protein
MKNERLIILSILVNFFGFMFLRCRAVYHSGVQSRPDSDLLATDGAWTVSCHPQGRTYKTQLRLKNGESAATEAFPDIVLSISDLLG